MRRAAQATLASVDACGGRRLQRQALQICAAHGMVLMSTGWCALISQSLLMRRLFLPVGDLTRLCQGLVCIDLAITPDAPVISPSGGI